MKEAIRIVTIVLGLSFIMTGCTTNETLSKDQGSKTQKEQEAAEEIILPSENTNTSDIVSDEQKSVSPSENDVTSINEDVEVLEITEKMYVSYVNEIYTNTAEYEGKNIKLEGMFTSAYDESTKQTYYFVYRTGPGCCNNDGSMCGFEFTTSDTIPEENDWIEVIGTLESYEENGYTYLTLRDAEVTIKTERGQEVVYQ
ncbi:TIGR03943 family putative permease subunit [Cellulosilyticum lentocellum]|uniref:DUF1980 domain-containing protein n=1 Tax=Cellulosilyticum lentocellum (strain ATCC 49066 / DSM 5427 / NCIMB 11756 / RHM5) TaxID=642492 RepID=F2JQF8_CELLD|nr:DUF1980 domain-containing protein [Cellulosilyticum lentocellum]ADZ84942.1 hypothetical protein Clole_3249 [Cellulosilyticum lentocellum DSM 5427]